ncbi:hypothetical protein RE0356_29940 [Prescottella equi]|nr:hypothetical protein RE0356_29940 [Prescottella equi]
MGTPSNRGPGREPLGDLRRLPAFDANWNTEVARDPPGRGQCDSAMLGTLRARGPPIKPKPLASTVGAASGYGIGKQRNNVAFLINLST